MSNVTIQRVEPDGISIKHASGIIKLFAGELPPDIREKYGLTPEAARRYQAQRSAALQARDSEMRANLEKRNAQWEREAQLKKEAKAQEQPKDSPQLNRRWKPMAGGGDAIDGTFIGLGSGYALFSTRKGYVARSYAVFRGYQQTIMNDYNNTLSADQKTDINATINACVAQAAAKRAENIAKANAIMAESENSRRDADLREMENDINRLKSETGTW